MRRQLTRTGRLGSRAQALASDHGGSINVLLALAIVPVVGLTGLGIDYGMAVAGRTRLDRAADAAAMAGLVTAKNYMADHAGENGVVAKAIAAGEKQAIRTFTVNAGSVPLTEVTLSPPKVISSGQTFTSMVTYTATIHNTIGKLFLAPTTTWSNTVTTSADLASYLDFYLMVDVSGSMGLPTTPTEMAKLAAVNRDKWNDYQQGCQFACHFPRDRYDTFKGWDQAKGTIQLRSDAVNDAVCSLLKRASTPLVPNQYRIGIYPFINQLATLAPLASSDSSLTTLSRAAQCAERWPLAFTNLLDTGTTQLAVNGDPTTGTGSGGTHFDKAFSQMRATVKTFGNGATASNPKPFVFVITDGMHNAQNFSAMKNGRRAYPGYPSSFRNYGNADWDGSKPAPINPADCADLKKDGATLSILYIPYNKIEYKENAGYIASENRKVNEFSPNLYKPLRECASPGFFFTANAPADITASLTAMFDQALKVARITN